MALPTDTKPPQLTPIDIQGLLDKPMPTLTSARPVSIQYSPTNLPQFMADRQEVAPGLFGRAGLLNIAPQVSSIQSTMPQDYLQEYADLERAFQESYAARPEYFGREYAVGQFIPGVPQVDVPIEEQPFDVTPLAASALIASPQGQELLGKALDVTFEPAEDIRDFVKEDIIESRPVQAVEDVVQSGFAQTKDALQDIYQSEPVQEFRTGIENLSDTITYPVKALADEIQNIIPEGTGTKIQEAKDDFIKVASDRLGIEGDFLPNLERKFEKVGEAAGAVSDVALGLQAPSYNNMVKAIDAVEKLNMLARGQEYAKVADYTPKPIETAYGTLEFKPVQAETVVGDVGYAPQVPELEDAEPLIPENIQKGLLSAASAYDVAQFAKDPSIEGAPSAYVSTSYLAEEFAGQKLPGVESAIVQGPLAAASVYGGLKALEGGIETPADFAAVVNAVPASALLTSYGADFLAGGASAVGTKVGAPALAEFASAATVPFALASLVQVAPDLLQGSALGDFPRFEAEVGLTNGNFDVVNATSYDAGTDFYAGGQAKNAVEFANYMVNNLGYEIDQEAYQDFKASDADTIVDDYGYFTKKHELDNPSHNAAAFIASMLEQGVLKPTENTPLDFNINEAIQVLDPSVSYFSPQEEQFASRNTNVDYILGEMYGRPTPTAPEITPEMIAGLPQLDIPSVSFDELGLPTTGIADDPRTRLREDMPSNIFGLEGLFV